MEQIQWVDFGTQNYNLFLNIHVNHFLKVTSYFKVLNTSLREIDDRWAGGKGPLAFEFR